MLRIEEIVKEPSLLKKDGEIWTLLQGEFEGELRRFLARFRQIRSAERRNDPAPDYPSLPFGKGTEGNFEWKLRRGSLRHIERLLSRRSRQTILEIGGWNGWLTNRLAAMGHEVIAVDYFSDEVDGLRAKRHYPNDWLALQTDIRDLGFFRVKFDVVVVNHCLQFLADPVGWLERLKPLVRDNGLIVLLGLSFYRNPESKRQQVEAFRRHYAEAHGFDIFLVPTKGYLDDEDRLRITSLGFRVIPDGGMIVRNVASSVNHSRPLYCYGWWRKR
jgi:SAM-dependent methyltransferase